METGEGRRLKQKLIIPLTKNETMARQYLVELADKVEEEMMWTVGLEDEKAAKDIVAAVEQYEKASRQEKSARME